MVRLEPHAMIPSAYGSLQGSHITFDLATMAPISHRPFPSVPPTCYRCGGSGDRYTTRCSNRNGNVGRPYYKCRNCRQFLVFADDRGNDPTNPVCHCGLSSKRQVASREKNRKIHYVCRRGGCDFYAPCIKPNMDSVVVTGDDIVYLLATLKIV